MLEVTVVRKGDRSDKASVNYRLVFVSAVPGFDYEDVEGSEGGSAYSEEGQSSRQTEIAVRPRPEWSSKSFLTVLEDIEGEAEFGS